MKRNVSAFTLVEVTLSLGIVAFALMTLLALLPAGLMAVKESSEERRAASVITALESDIRNIQDGQNNSAIYGVPVWAGNASDSATKYLGSNGEVVTAQADADLVLSWKVNRPPTTAPGDPITIWVRVAWPGRAPTPTSWVETIVTVADRSF